MRPALLLLLLAAAARGQDPFEIQVYDAKTAPPGSVGLEVHLNGVLSGSEERSPAGELPTRHVIHATLEPHLGITSWLEVGGYLQSALRPEGSYDYAGAKLRLKARLPEPAFGWLEMALNGELSWIPARYEAARHGGELRPSLAGPHGLRLARTRRRGSAGGRRRLGQQSLHRLGALAPGPHTAPRQPSPPVGTSTTPLLGERYALVRPEIRRVRPIRAQEPAGPFRALVALGDHDPHHQTGEITRILMNIAKLDRVDMATKPQNPDLLRLLVEQRPPLDLHRYAEDAAQIDSGELQPDAHVGLFHGAPASPGAPGPLPIVPRPQLGIGKHHVCVGDLAEVGHGRGIGVGVGMERPRELAVDGLHGLRAGVRPEAEDRVQIAVLHLHPR